MAMVRKFDQINHAVDFFGHFSPQFESNKTLQGLLFFGVVP